ncbi:5'-3' exonuclease [Nocardioides iriomotensis]|uniref:5'-3' exonuclease n=1 Tax=Nocardioides iriomotensis TaxID=715784 RepID=A0A4Q5JB90_9ACTN|nr:5'-3' exonuclease H3TH domain-containing protein [Nocardioides iriomotensis]RYU15269.1 flap endonuclease [Nocardioides iriomotensis]
MAPTLLAIDGNSVLHRCFHASARTGFRTADGQAAWAVRGFLSMLGAAVDRACADAVVVGFDDPDVSHRRTRWPIYKAHRDPKPATLDEQLETAVHVLRDLGVVVVRPDGLEADDVLASAAAWAPSVGACTVIATSDRDSFGLIDDNTRMLRILNGGVDASPMLDPHRLTLVAGVRPEQYLDYAALRGDASDNLPGVRGFGPKTAAKLLAAFATAEEAFTEAATDGERCRAAVGKALAATLATSEARAAFQLNRAVMTMHRDVPLGLDIPRGVGRLPLDLEQVRSVLARFDLRTPSLVRALTGAEPPEPRPVDVDTAWRPPRARSAARFPPLPKQPEPDPTLF